MAGGHSPIPFAVNALRTERSLPTVHQWALSRSFRVDLDRLPAVASCTTPGSRILARAMQKLEDNNQQTDRKESPMIPDRLDKHEVFQFLRPDQLRAISDVAQVMECEAGKTIYERGAKADHFYVVLRGQVSLRLPSKSGVSIQIDELTEGAVFGSCVCFQFVEYSLNAQCTADSKLLKIESATLKELMDQDLLMGYTIQTQISRIYFNRYIQTMKKLQSIVMNLPLETEESAAERTPVAV
jgi:CRP-like cAMP-binding protein